ncbi:MAG: RNA methyltransferase [Rickettsiales bacterium]|nr:RNA methyltransferase [Rickettsiales bacterium]
MHNNISIVLVSPQKGENIGFVARSMMNFGLSDLRIVTPRDGWPNDNANITAVKAVSILDNAKIFDSFREAIKDLNYLYVTTARNRSINQRAIDSLELSEDINRKFESGIEKIGVVFGPERSGVENDVLSICNTIVHIPVNANFASLNLGMAAGIICYEVTKTFNRNVVYKNNNTELASFGDISNLLLRLDTMLQSSNFYQVPEKRIIMLHNLNSLISRIELLTKNEINTLIGIFRSLYDHKA